MQLDRWLIETNTSQSALARAIGILPSSVNRLVKGKAFPNFDTIERIRIATKDAVTADDWASRWRERAAANQQQAAE
jgi:transcriptional regulator with XRE-family HTH domain